MNEDQNKNFHQYESYQPHLQPVHQSKGGFAGRANAWLAKHRWPVLATVIILILGIGGTFLYGIWSLNFDSPFANSTIKPNEKFYSPLTGAEVSKEDSERPVIAVMVENSPEARPQSGLKDAGLIFESVAEGGITRFLLLYQEGKPELIGPVRSIRPQFASWAAAFDAGVAHVGGSEIPLQKLRSGQIKDLDQFFNAGAYWRASDRRAPHNVYTSAERLHSLTRSKGYQKSDFKSWERTKKSKPAEQPTARSITVPVSSGQFSVGYTWDQATNTYTRTLAGTPHSDREKGQVAPAVVIAMQVPHDVIRDSNGYSYPDANTNGKAWVFQNGTVSEVSWSKTSDAAQIQLKDASGKPVALAPGQTWVTAIRPDVTPAWQ